MSAANCSSSPSASAAAAGASAAETAGAIICVIVSSMSTTFGLFFQKIAQERGGICGHPEDSKRDRRISFAYWFGGFALITFISFALDLYSMASLGQSLVVPLLASLEVAENQVFAPCVLHEALNKRYDYTAAVVVVVGAALTTVFGPKEGASSSTTASTTYDANCTAIPGDDYAVTKVYFEDLFKHPTFLAFESVVVVVFIVCALIMKFEPAWARPHLFLPYGYVAGFLGGQQNLFLKGVGTLFTLAFSADGGAVFGDWMIYVFILGMASLAPTQLAVINSGLAKFSALDFVPAYTVLYIIHGTSVGLFFYQEHSQLDGLQWGMFALGFVFIFAALGILAVKPHDEHQLHDGEHDKEYHDDDEVGEPPEKPAELRSPSSGAGGAGPVLRMKRAESAGSAASSGDAGEGRPRRNSFMNLLTHSEQGTPTLSRARSYTTATPSPSSASRSVSSGGSSRRARPSIMIAFGGGLLMSHKMSSKPLRTADKPGRRGSTSKSVIARRLHRMSTTPATAVELSRKVGFKHHASMPSSIGSPLSSLSDIEEGAVGAEKSVDDEGHKREPAVPEAAGSSAAAASDVEGPSSISTKMGPGRLMQVREEDGVSVIALEWRLSTGRPAMMYVPA